MQFIYEFVNKSSTFLRKLRINKILKLSPENRKVNLVVIMGSIIKEKWRENRIQYFSFFKCNKAFELLFHQILNCLQNISTKLAFSRAVFLQLYIRVPDCSSCSKCSEKLADQERGYSKKKEKILNRIALSSAF